MATLAELQDALINADKAGDVDAARKLADAIHSMQSVQDAKPASVKAGQELNSIPRQLGLTARYGLEGLANAAQIVTEPIRYFTDKLVPDRASPSSLGDIVTGKVVAAPPKSLPLGVVASNFADWIGLPKPQSATERVIADATRLGFGTIGTMGAGALAKGAGGVLGAAGDMLTAAPTSQVASAAGSGLAGGASREAGGNELQQGASAVIGGLSGAGAASLAKTAASKATALKNALMTPQQMDVKIEDVLRRVGVDYSQVPERVRQSLRSEIGNALRADQELDPAAVARLLDFRRNGLTPTRGMVTLDPVQITREQNLAKTAANSADGELHGLPRVQNQNNARLIQNLNQAGATQGNVDAAGNLVSNTIAARRDALRNAEQSAWDAARSSPGYTQPISAGPLSAVNAALDAEGMMPFMDQTISSYMAAFQNGAPFTPQAYRNLQSMLARAIQKGGNEGHAATVARRALEASELKPAGFANTDNALVTSRMAQGMQAADANAADAIDAVNRARQATRQAYAYEDSSPLVRSVLSDGASADPQRIAKRFVIGSTPTEAQDMANQLTPQGREVVKNALVYWLKDKALNGAADEVGKFSQSAFNKALRQLEEGGKLRLFFSADEVENLRSMGRAASYMQAQPVGSAVNNSNSGALLLGRGLDMLNNVPFVGPLTVPALKNVQITLGNRQAQQVLPGLLAAQPKTPFLNSFAAPAIAAGGLLSAP